MKNSKIANVNIKIKDLFYSWLEITNAFHKLTNQQQSVLALFLYYHYKFKKDITNKKVLWKMVFDYDTKLLIKEELGIKDAGFQNIMNKLRSKNIIRDKQIISTYIPNLELGSKEFQITFNFNIIHE